MAILKISKTRLQLAKAIVELDQDHDTSMGVWMSYWEVRNALRSLALERYEGVQKHYLDKGWDTGHVSEGFKEIAQDETKSMRVVRGDC